ncbi:MAG: hypothetical protein IJJ96_09555 [Bacteroidales bacterium]|nr:hypothetical protein [Bacteroidales bacterium]
MRQNYHIITTLYDKVLKSIGYIEPGLMRLILQENGTQDDLDTFLKDWDIEKAPIKLIILLAYVMKTRPDLSFPDIVAPRFNGVLSYIRFKNLRTEVIFHDIIKSFKEKGLRYLVIGDMAMWSFCPEYPWWIDRIEILVPEKDRDSAIKTAASIVNGDILNIHSAYYPVSEAVFNRSCPEDLAFFSLVNLYDDLIEGHSLDSCLTSLLSIKYLIKSKETFDSGIVLENAVLGKKCFQVSLASKVVSSLFPGLVPEQLVETPELSGRLLRKRLVNFLFKRDVLSKTGERGLVRGKTPSVLKYLIWRYFKT